MLRHRAACRGTEQVCRRCHADCLPRCLSRLVGDSRMQSAARQSSWLVYGGWGLSDWKSAYRASALELPQPQPRADLYAAYSTRVRIGMLRDSFSSSLLNDVIPSHYQIHGE